jgi:hypothetical protein
MLELKLPAIAALRVIALLRAGAAQMALTIIFY